MGDIVGDSVDRGRACRRHARETFGSPTVSGLLLFGTAMVAFVVCVVSFAERHVGLGIAAVVIWLLAAGAGLAWLAMEERRVRHFDRERNDCRSATDR